MFRVIINFLFKDLRWKLLSVGLAIVLWMVGMNVNNPSSVAPFHRLLKISNAEILTRDNIVILNESELRGAQITVNVRAPQSELSVLDNRPDNIEASVDLKQVNPDTVLEMIESTGKPAVIPLDVYADILEGYEWMSIRPRTVDVKLDKHIRQSFPVQIVREGEIQQGYELISTECVNKNIIISGAKSIVEEVSAVQCRVNLANADQDFDQAVRLAAVDRDGNDITHRLTELSVRETQVHVSILPYKPIPIDISWTGTLAHNHIVTGIHISPEWVDVIGPQEILDTIDNLTLTPLDLTAAKTTQTFGYDLYQALPDTRLTLRGGQSDAAIIAIIEPMRSQEFWFPVGEIQILGFPAGAVQLMNNESIRFTVIGSETDMAGLTRGNIRVSLNLTGLAVGNQSVPLTILLPQGISLVGQPPQLELLLTTPDPNAPVEMPEETAEETVHIDDVPEEEPLPTENAENIDEDDVVPLEEE